MAQDDIEEILILSPMQRLMLIHELSGTGSMALKGQFRYRISGVVDAPRLTRAWQVLVDRHAALRTCFLWEGLDEPVQVVRNSAKFQFEHHDLTGLSAEVQEQRLAELRDADWRKGIDLRRAPLLRAQFARLAEDRCDLLVTRHHLIMDRWCLEVMFEELFQAYRQDDPDCTASWPAPGRFQDYLRWIQTQDHTATSSFWQESLRGFEEPTLLFDPASASSAVTSDMWVTRHDVDPTTTQAVSNCAVTAKVTQATVMQAAVGLVVAQQTGRRDVVFGLTVSGRPPELPGIEQCLGSFINCVPSRVRFDVGQSVAAWLRAMQTTHGRRGAHEHLSLADIQSCSSLAAGTSFFDLLLLMHSPLKDRLQGPGFALEQLDSPIESSFPLTLSVELEDGRLSLVAVYEHAIVSRERADSLLAAVARGLADISACVEDDVGSLVSGTCTRDAATLSSRPAKAPIAHTSKMMAEDPAGCLRELMAQALGRESVGLDDDFFALGGTSLQAAALFASVERHFGQQLPLSTLLKAGSVRTLLRVLGQPIPRATRLVSFQPSGVRPPLFFVPGIGGNVVGLKALARVHGPAQPFFAFESRGLDGRETPLERVEDIAAEYVAAMPTDTGVFGLCGFCWGSVVAVEMAQQLQAAGRPPLVLVLMDPVIAKQDAADPGLKARPNANLGFVQDRLRSYRNELEPLGLLDRGRWVGNKVKSFAQRAMAGEQAAETRIELAQRKVINANMTAHDLYQPRPYGGRSVMMLTARQGIDPADDPRLPWLDYLPQGTTVLQVAAETTGEAVSGQNAVILAKHISEQLDLARTQSLASV